MTTTTTHTTTTCQDCTLPGIHSAKNASGRWATFCEAHVSCALAKRSSKAQNQDLPRIVEFLGRSDAGEFGAATCPHCGADGRYVSSFRCSDGTTRGAMAGCIQFFPVSPIATEQAKIMERKADREAKGQKLASWDQAKLDAMSLYYAGQLGEGEVLATIATQNAKRQAWLDRKYGRGGRR